MVNAQEWLNKEFPVKNRSLRRNLCISNNNLEGCLDLTSFPILGYLDCSGNYITEIILPISVTHLDLHDNCLELLEFLEKMGTDQRSKLFYLNIGSNNFFSQDLSVLKGFIGLISFILGNYNEEKIKNGFYNRFSGSLRILEKMKNLSYLSIDNLPNIGNDWFFLNNKLKSISFSSEFSLEIIKIEGKTLEESSLEKMKNKLLEYKSIEYVEETRIWKINMEKAKQKFIKNYNDIITDYKSQIEASDFVNSVLARKCEILQDQNEDQQIQIEVLKNKNEDQQRQLEVFYGRVS